MIPKGKCQRVHDKVLRDKNVSSKFMYLVRDVDLYGRNSRWRKNNMREIGGKMKAPP